MFLSPEIEPLFVFYYHITRSGQIIGPATFLGLNRTLCLVILEEDSITPESTIYTFISCEDIESVSLTS